MEQSGQIAPRSRFGCLTCRRKHRKCDEQRPVCKPCQSRGLQCAYQVTLKWADSHNITTFNESLREKDRSAKRPANSAVRRVHPSPTLSRRGTPNGRSRPSRPSDQVAPHNAAPESPSLGTTAVEGGGRVQQSFTVDGDTSDFTRPSPASTSLSGLSGSVTRLDEVSWLGLPILEHAQGVSGALSCDHLPVNDYFRDHDGALEEQVRSADFDENSEDDVEQSGPGDDTRDGADPGHWVVDDLVNNFLMHVFQEPSEEIAFVYYFKRVCTCTPAYDSGRNPYRKLALVSLSYPVVLHGIPSVSTAHMHNYGRSNEALLSVRQARALNSLRETLSALLGDKNEYAVTANESSLLDGSGVLSVLSAREIALAAVMMQTSSVLMTGIGNVEVHIKCALEFIRHLGYLHQPARPVIGRLLVNRFAMVDVVLAHLRFRRPLAPPDFFMYQNNESLDQEEPSFREMQGCAQRVLSFLAQIACLSAEIAENRGAHPEIQARAYGLETEMRIWGHHYYSALVQAFSTQPISLSRTGTEGRYTTDQRRDLDVVCECFYWTAHILLLRRVFLDPSRSTRVQLIRRHMFQLMDALQPGCGPDSSLPFSFYMASREAVTLEERDWVRRKHAAMMDIYRDQSREHMMASTEKIWEKAEKADGQLLAGVPLLETAYEKFIRDTDKEASYFMF